MKTRNVKVKGYLVTVCPATGRVFCYLSGEEITGRFNETATTGYRKLRVRNEMTCVNDDFYVHQVVCAAKLGMNPLELRSSGLQVDHINQNKLDNSFKNLQLLTTALHKRKTAIERALKREAKKLLKFPEIKKELKKRLEKLKAA